MQVSDIISLLAFVVMLVVVVVIHELGHYGAAKWCGIPVAEFGLGYRPRAKLLGHWRGTDFTLNWLPLGGFVRFDRDQTTYGNGVLDAAPPWKRIVVLVAGPCMNVLLAWVLFVVVTLAQGIGQPTDAYQIASVIANTPAAQAGLLAGDIIRTIDGEPAILHGIGGGNTKPMQLTIERDKKFFDLTLQPATWTDEQGAQAGVGIYFLPLVEYTRVSFPLAMWHAVERCVGLLTGTLTFLGTALVGFLTWRPVEGAALVGPIGLLDITTNVVSSSGWIGFASLVAYLSLNLALLNMLPFPALDGSHIVIACIEWVRRKALPAARVEQVHAVGFTMLLMLMVIVAVQDVSRLLGT